MFPLVCEQKFQVSKLLPKSENWETRNDEVSETRPYPREAFGLRAHPAALNGLSEIVKNETDFRTHRDSTCYARLGFSGGRGKVLRRQQAGQTNASRSRCDHK